MSISPASGSVFSLLPAENATGNFTKVIQRATLRDFAGADGRSGYFQQDLYVYGREGEPCRVCGSAIRSLRLGNRQSCYCPRCQR